MSTTPNLGLPYIDAGQAQKHVTHNEALRALDTLVQLAVLDRDLTAPPSSPAEGQRWIVKAGATDAWASRDNQLAAWQDGAWQFSVPVTGWIAYIADEEILAAWDGSAWSEVSSGGENAREVLAANRTYYVRSDGSDSNTGLANTAGGAFATIQKAWNTLVTIDLNGFTVTIKLGNTVTLTAGLNASVSPVGGNVIIEGDTAAPANTVISTTNADAIRISCAANVTLQYLKLQTTTGGECLRVFHPAANVAIGNGMNWGASADCHMRVEKGGMLQLQNPSGYEISGGAAFHYFVQDGGKIQGITLSCTLSGAPSFSGCFVDSEWGGVVDFFGFSVASGSATGKRFNAANGGMINTYGGGASYWPGNVAGTGTNLGTSPYGMYV